MKLENLAFFFARLSKIYTDYNITPAGKAIKLDESGCLVQSARRAKKICLKGVSVKNRLCSIRQNMPIIS